MRKGTEYLSGVSTPARPAPNETIAAPVWRGRECVAGAVRRLLMPALRLAQSLAAARRRRQAIRELRALDERLLADLGLERAGIPEYVDRLLESGQNAARTDADAGEAARGRVANPQPLEVIDLVGRRRARAQRREVSPASCCADGAGR